MLRSRRPGASTTPVVQYPIIPRLIEVASIEELGPRYRRIAFRSEQLAADFPYPPMAPADHVKLVLPDGEGELVWPGEGPGGLRRRDDGRLPLLRDYTVRRYDPRQRLVTLDFVLHEHGPAGRWAMAATPGDRLGMLGPRGSRLFPDTHARYLVLADETALPAAGRWLETVPASAAVEVLALVDAPGAEVPLTGRPELDARIRFLHRGDGVEEPLLAALRAVAPGRGDFVWAAGEAGMLKGIRRFLREESGLDRAQWEVDGYWKLGIAGHDHHAPIEDGTE